MKLRIARVATALLGFFLFAPVSAMASTSGATLPFIAPLRTVVDNLTGPFAFIVALGSAAVAATTYLMSPENSGLKSASRWVIGASCIVGLPSLLTALGITGAIY